MNAIQNYVKPELLIVAIVLYFLGMWLKQAAFMKDKYIPLVLGIAGVNVTQNGDKTIVEAIV